MTRLLKKFFSLLISSFAVLILSGFIALEPVKEHRALASHNLGQVPPGQPQQAQGVANCRDLTMVPEERGLTEPVPAPDQGGRHGGVFDSGQLDFNQPAAPNEASQTCVGSSLETLPLNTTQRAQDTTDITGRFLKGWTWNTNLGWLGFRCIGGKNTNDGDCGADINYGVFVDPTDDGTPNEGSLRGFSWGDNIGWLSMGCSGGRNVGVNCGNKEYGVRMAMADGTSVDSCLRPEGDGTLKRGDLYGFAWSDSIGWINFCGAHLDLQGNFSAAVSILGNADGSPLYANVIDHYTVKIQVFENGVPIDFKFPDNPNREFTLAGSKGVNTLRTDQVTPCGENGQPNCVYNGISLLPGNPWQWDEATKSFYMNVGASAPTGPLDQISFESFTVEVRDPASDIVLQSFEIPVQNGNLEFKPVVSVTKISTVDADDTVRENTLETVPRDSQQIKLETAIINPGGPFVVDTGKINIHRQIYDCSGDEYDFWFGTAEDQEVNQEGALNVSRTSEFAGCVLSDTEFDSLTLSPPDSVDLEPDPSFIYTNPVSVSGGQKTDALGFQSIIEYIKYEKTIRYYSLSKREGAVLNQAADIVGNVRIDVVDTSGLPATDRIASSIGERAQSKRTEFYRAIKQTLGGKAPQAIVNNQATVNFNQAQNGILHFRRDKTVDAPCKIILDSDSFNAATTIVSEGCDIYIDSDILPAAAQEPRLGIIALQDFSLSGERRGGNVYLCSTVTDVKANFVLDGSLFSYGESSDACGADKNLLVDAVSGKPKFFESMRSVLKHQLTIVGSLISNNTYGGSLQQPPLLGGGEVGTSSALARLYDINFLRYAKVDTDLDAYNNGDHQVPACWAEGVNLSKIFTPNPTGDNWDACDNMTNNPVYKDANIDIDGHAIINIIYRGPASDMPIFKAVKGR